METVEQVQLPDGTFALIDRSMTYGEAVIILVLVALLVLKLYELWRKE